VLTEFQLVDRRTDEANERGPANHEAYKARQFDRVWTRLQLGSSEGGFDSDD